MFIIFATMSCKLMTCDLSLLAHLLTYAQNHALVEFYICNNIKSVVLFVCSTLAITITVSMFEALKFKPWGQSFQRV